MSSSGSLPPRGAEPADKPVPDRSAFDERFQLVYGELRMLARLLLWKHGRVTLDSVGLVDEAWLKLKGAPSLAETTIPHFKAIAAKAMRQVLVDAARRRASQKRDVLLVTLDESSGVGVATSVEVLALHQALDRLAELNPRQAQMVECRFFSGLSVRETADALGVSETMVERDWRAAKAWLAVAIRTGGGD
jgi:RNA polymerase sigma factor (TIGR02999 family)